MNKLFFLIGGFMIAAVGYAQPSATMVEYQKVSRQGIVADIPFTEKSVAKALQGSMEKMGYNGKDSKDFTVYKGVRLKELGEEAYDLYFLIDKKSRKDKDNSTVTLVISSGYDKFITESENMSLFNNAKTYLTNLRDVVAAYDLDQEIILQEKTVRSNEKKAADLSEDAEDLQKKKKKLENDIEENENDQEKQKQEVEKQKQILETLRTKRKG